MEKAIARYEPRVAKIGDKDAKARIEVLQKLRVALDQGSRRAPVALEGQGRPRCAGCSC